MRGTVRDLENAGKQYGITPAHAGNRRILKKTKTSTGDHPRPCGEQQKIREVVDNG